MSEFDAVFDQARAVFKTYESEMVVLSDEPGKYTVASPLVIKNNEPIWFGSVEIKKNYVSVHLLPVYMRPSLLEGLSPSLLKRKQGKACFNFNKVDPALMLELGSLVERCIESFRSNPQAF